jgi:hypothetical protein
MRHSAPTARQECGCRGDQAEMNAPVDKILLKNALLRTKTVRMDRSGGSTKSPPPPLRMDLEERNVAIRASGQSTNC